MDSAVVSTRADGSPSRRSAICETKDMAQDRWNTGDRVVHPGKPEWGIGTVTGVEPATQDGKPCQRVTARFDRAGLKTLSTAYATLQPPGDVGALEMELREQRGLPDADEHEAARAFMAGLPDELVDPFADLAERLRKSLEYYRYQPSGAGLIDWASIRSGLTDPLSRFNRHELEELFQRFRTSLDNHVTKLVRELARKDRDRLESITHAASPDAQRAMRRLDALR